MWKPATRYFRLHPDQCDCQCQIRIYGLRAGCRLHLSENSRENKLSSLINDPIQDTHSEAFYIRDEVKRKYWSPTPGPVNSSGFYRVIHGFGFTRFEHFSNGLDQTLIQFVPQHESVKISKLILKIRVAKPKGSLYSDIWSGSWA